jgi:hypothetical protein
VLRRRPHHEVSVRPLDGRTYTLRSKAHSIKAQTAGRLVSHRSAFVESVVALIVIILAFAVLICLATIAPAVWTFATAAAVESYIPVGPSQCLSIKDGPRRLACYDELSRRPAKGAMALRRRSAKHSGGGDHSHAPHLDAAGHTSWELTEWNDG